MIRPSQLRELSRSRAGPTLDSDGATPGPVGVGRVAAEQQQAVAADLGQPRDVRRAPVDRRLVELVVAGHQHRAELGGDQDHAADVGDRVGRGGPSPARRARAFTFSPAGSPASVASRELVLVELRPDHADGQQAAVDHRGLADLAQHVRQRADVVLVAVGEDDRLDVVGALAQVGEVRQDEVDAEHLRGREHQPGVDDDDAARRTRRPSCSCRSRPARRAAAPEASCRPRPSSSPSTVRPTPSSAVRTAARCSSSSGTMRQAHRAAGDQAGISSAALIGIGFVVTESASNSGCSPASICLRPLQVPVLRGVPHLAHLRADDVGGDEDAACSRRFPASRR